ncbi:hypothetical protein IG631_05727 [Alternaria alternata]|nr:hypothetical protein IG631_05727 [Alternaria alternata]
MTSESNTATVSQDVPMRLKDRRHRPAKDVMLRVRQLQLGFKASVDKLSAGIEGRKGVRSGFLWRLWCCRERPRFCANVPRV